MIAIVDYGVGNLFSQESSFAAIGEPVTVTGDAKVLREAERIARSQEDLRVRLAVCHLITRDDLVKKLQQPCAGKLVAHRDLKALILEARNLKRVELLRYNKVAGAKYNMVGMTYKPSFDTEAEPQIQADILKEAGIEVLVL